MNSAFDCLQVAWPISCPQCQHQCLHVLAGVFTKMWSLHRGADAARAAQVTVLQIAALKKVSKGTRVLLLDRNGGGAKAIARELTRRGFRKVFVVQGGFSGWTSSKLQTKLSSTVCPARCAVPPCKLPPTRSVHQAGRRIKPELSSTARPARCSVPPCTLPSTCSAHQAG